MLQNSIRFLLKISWLPALTRVDRSKTAAHLFTISISGNMYNNPSTPPPATDANASGKKTRLLVILLFGVLTVLNVAFFMLRKDSNIIPVQMELSEKEQALSELDIKYNAAKAQLDSLKSFSPENSERIEALQAELDTKRADIEQNIRLKGDLADARREIEALVQQKDNAVMEVARLKEKVQVLDNQVSTLTFEKRTMEAEKQQYETGLTEVRTQLDEVQTAKAALIAEKTRLEQSNYDKESQIDAGRFLNVSGVTVKTVAVNSKGKEKNTPSRKMIDQIKICFQVTKNALVPIGEEKFYLKIIDPAGATVYREDQGSGTTTEKESNADFRYTTIATCNYQRQDTEACGLWNVGADTPGKGKYTVEIYNRGRRVGDGAFKIK